MKLDTIVNNRVKHKVEAGEGWSSQGEALRDQRLVSPSESYSSPSFYIEVHEY